MKLIKLKHLLIISIIGLLIVLFGWQGVLELRAEEPRRAVVAMEMLFSDNYIIPKISGWSYYNKPPVFNWIMVLFFKLFNSLEEWVVRMPSLVSLLVLAVVNYKIVKKWLDKKIAVLSSLFFLTSAEILFYGSINSGEIDFFYSLIVFLQVMSLFHFYEKKNYLLLFLCSYFLMATGLLTKGLTSFAFQVFSLFGLVLYSKNWKIAFTWQHLAGIIVLITTIGGYLYAYNQYDDALNIVINQFKEASDRVTSLLKTIVNFFLFPFFLGKLVFPWALFLPFLIIKNIRQQLWDNKLLRYGVFFCVTNLPLYWLSGNLKGRYLYMFFPFLCLFAAYAFCRVDSSNKYFDSVKKIFSVITFLVPIASVVAVFVPITAGLPNFVLKSILVFAIASFLVYCYYKTKQYGIYYFILIVITARLLFNFTYLPALQQQSKTLVYRNEMKKITAITKNEQVFLYGEPHQFKAKATIGSLKIKERTLTTAPLIAYQIPYYLTKYTEKPLIFHEVMETGNYYILPKKMLESELPLYTFFDLWLNSEMVLIRKT